jgi:hypothetical protein
MQKCDGVDVGGVERLSSNTSYKCYEFESLINTRQQGANNGVVMPSENDARVTVWTWSGVGRLSSNSNYRSMNSRPHPTHATGGAGRPAASSCLRRTMQV